MTKYELGSAAWVAAAERVLDDIFAGVDLSGVEYSLSEEYTDPPAHLLGQACDRKSIGWAFRIADGKIAVSTAPDSTAELRITGDYAVILRIGRLVVDGDPGRRAELNRLMSDGRSAGTFAVVGDFASSAAIPQLAPLARLHDDIARQTA